MQDGIEPKGGEEKATVTIEVDSVRLIGARKRESEKGLESSMKYKAEERQKKLMEVYHEEFYKDTVCAFGNRYEFRYRTGCFGRKRA